MRATSIATAVALLAASSSAQGSDDCANPQVLPSAGMQPFDLSSATTGTQGQGNPCGLIERDVWFTWTATRNGQLWVTACFPVALGNSKIAVYAGAGCPSGLALGCSDLGCIGFPQGNVQVPETLGATYTIQIGNTPGYGTGPDYFDLYEAPPPPMTRSCFPGTNGVLACPCGQPPNPSGGCRNFGAGATSGARLDATGAASLAADTITLQSTNHRQPPTGILNVFFAGSGSLSNGTVNGAGVRCVATALKRLYTGQAMSGSIARPSTGDPSVSARSAQLGVPISAGETRHYFCVYRDAAAAGPCGNTASTVNTTNSGSILWSP